MTPEIAELLRAYPFTPRTQHYDVATRTNDAGLRVSTTIYWGDDEEHVSVVERTETFVVEAVRRVGWSGHTSLQAGERAHVWRSTTVYTSGYTPPREGCESSLNGYRVPDGRQALSWSSDEEARGDVRAVRNADGTVLRAADDPSHEYASEAYSYLMSR